MKIQFKNLAVISGILLTTAAFSTPAFSADSSFSTGGYAREMYKMDMMKMLDADGNHMVSKAEADSFYGSLFDALDTDKDGDHKVTKEEFLKLNEAQFSAMDKSGDGQLDPQEWLAKQTGNK